MLDDDAGRLLARARAGEIVTRELRVADLEPGDVGVLHVTVQHVRPARTFRRKRGGEGLLQRVSLADATGEVDLVLWDDETNQVRDGPLRPGAALRIAGATVKRGYRGGVELGLGRAQVERLASPDARTDVEGALHELGETRVVGEPPDVRFSADARIGSAEGPVNVVLWDESLRAARGLLPGARVCIEAALPHPALPGWYVTDASSRLRRA